AFHEGVDADYEREHGRDEQPDRAHSVLLDVALAAGIPGLAAWLAVMAIIARALWRSMRSTSWVAGLAVGLASHWAGQLFLFPVVEVEPWTWLLAGFLVGHAASAPVSDTVRRRPHHVAGVALVGLALAAVVVGGAD